MVWEGGASGRFVALFLNQSNGLQKYFVAGSGSLELIFRQICALGDLNKG